VESVQAKRNYRSGCGGSEKKGRSKGLWSKILGHEIDLSVYDRDDIYGVAFTYLFLCNIFMCLTMHFRYLISQKIPHCGLLKIQGRFWFVNKRVDGVLTCFVKGIMSPVEYFFLNANKIKSVFSWHTQMIFKFLACLVIEKNQHKVFVENCENHKRSFKKYCFEFLGPSKQMFISWHYPFNTCDVWSRSHRNSGDSEGEGTERRRRSPSPRRSRSRDRYRRSRSAMRIQVTKWSNPKDPDPYPYTLTNCPNPEAQKHADPYPQHCFSCFWLLYDFYDLIRNTDSCCISNLVQIISFNHIAISKIWFL
jgi:hypothetical protein